MICLIENDVIELFEKKYRKDPRKKPFPGESALRKHQLQSEFTNYKIVNYPKQRKDLFRIVVTDNFENKPKTESIECSPIPGDLVIYRQSDNCLLRCVIDNFKFNQNKIIYKIRLLDEDKILEAPIESLLRTSNNNDDNSNNKMIMGQLLIIFVIITIVLSNYYGKILALVRSYIKL